MKSEIFEPVEELLGGKEVGHIPVGTHVWLELRDSATGKMQIWLAEKRTEWM